MGAISEVLMNLIPNMYLEIALSKLPPNLSVGTNGLDPLVKYLLG